MRSNPPRRITSLPKLIVSCSIVTVISVPPIKIWVSRYFNYNRILAKSQREMKVWREKILKKLLGKI